MAFASFSTPSLLLEEGGVVTISLEFREKEKIPCNKRTTKYTTNLFWDGSQQSQSGCEVTSCKSVWLIAKIYFVLINEEFVIRVISYFGGSFCYSASQRRSTNLAF